LDSAYIVIEVQNRYFDFNNIDDPVQYYTDTIVNRPLMYVFNTIMNLKMRKHVYHLNDNLLGLNPSDEGTFFSVVKEDEYLMYSTNTTAFFLCTIVLDSRIDVYQRTLRNSIDVLGDIGGLFEALHILVMLSLGYFVKKMFDHEINKKIYDYYNNNSEKRIGEESMYSAFHSERIPNNNPSQFRGLQNEISQIKHNNSKILDNNGSSTSIPKRERIAVNKVYTSPEELKEELKVPSRKKAL